MTRRLEGKLALVTAAGQGIGRAIAEAFVAEGAGVIATDLEEEKLRDLVGADRRKLDVRSTAEVEALAKAVAKETGVPNVLVNCAGYVHNGSVLDCSEDDWNFSFDLNVTSIHRTLRAFLPGMLARGGGSIINISSAVSSIRGVPNRYAYGATKAAIIGLTKAVAADFIQKGIRANAICPGTIELPSLGSAHHHRWRARAAVRSRTYAAASSIASPWAGSGMPRRSRRSRFFSHPTSSSYITGQPHLVDGGMAL